MANRRHIELLDKGVREWNAWCDRNQDVRADLRGADLAEFELDGVNLFGADLNGADLGGADLREAVLTNVQLIRGRSPCRCSRCSSRDEQGTPCSNTGPSI